MNICSLLPILLLAALQIQFQLLVLPLTSPEQPEALNPGLSFSRTLRVTIQKQRIDGWDAGAQEPMKLSHNYIQNTTSLQASRIGSICSLL